MRQIRLGRSELIVSRIAFGTWQLGGDWGATDERQAIAAIREAADEGVTLFDTAQAYGFGASERLLARALKGRPRDGLFLATKGGLRPAGNGIERDSSPEWIRKGVEESLRALGSDYIDLYQLHWPDPKTPFADTARTLGELIAEGKVRHVGVSNFDVEQMEEFSVYLPVETVQPPYDLFRRAIEEKILPYTAESDIGVLAYGALAHGLLTGALRPDTVFPPGDWRASSPDFKAAAFRQNLEVVSELSRLAAELGLSVSQMAVAWTLTNPAVQVVIVGTRNPEHVHDAVSAGGVDLDTDVLTRIDEIMRSASPVIGPAPETMPT